MKKATVILILPLIFTLLLNNFSFSATDEEVKKAVLGGQNYLISNQEPDGYWYDSKQGLPLASTAFAVAALLESGVPRDNSAIISGIEYIKQFVQEDGGIYDPAYSSYANYINSICIIALSLYGDTDANFRKLIEDAVNYTLSRQNLPVPEGETMTPQEYYGAYYGGWTYRKTSKGELSEGDLSNTQYAVMGLWYGYRYLGKSIIGEPWAKALFTYLGRSHGWYDKEKGQTWNDQEWAAGKNSLGEDGAFSYEPDSAQFYPGGSMTGAGIWCLAMIGEDQHEMVSIAIEWFKNNYDWSRNPGAYYDYTPDMAYYYFVYTMAKALTATLGTEQKVGNHNWVQDLKDMLVHEKMLSVEGDPSQNYWEGTGDLDGGNIIATSWVLMSLAFADPNVESQHKLLADNPDLNYPIRGLIILTTGDGITISDAKRGYLEGGTKDTQVELPVGSLSCKLNHVEVGGKAVLKMELPLDAFDPDNPASFIASIDEESQSPILKDGFSWSTIKDGKWEALFDIPIEIDIDANIIKVTLKDGGEEDQDGAEDGIITLSPSAAGFGFEEGEEGCGCTSVNPNKNLSFFQILVWGLIFLISIKRFLAKKTY